MGDRANVRVVDGKSAIYLYTHWSGNVLPKTLQRAMDSEAGRRRWDDGSYLARIIFCEMVKDDISGETGYGISSTCGDGEDRVLTVNVDNQMIYRGETYSKSEKALTFEEFANADGARWEDF